MYEVKTANDGEEALNYIYSDIDNKIIGMFLDLNMPKVNGFQVLEYFDKNNLFQKLGIQLEEVNEEKNYAANCRKIKEYREKEYERIGKCASKKEVFKF